MGVSAATIDGVAWRSPWRRRAVAEKAALYGGIVLLALVLPPWPALPLLLLTALGSARLAQVSLGHIYRCARAPAVFIVVAAASTAVSVDFAAWRIAVTQQAASTAVALGFRAFTASVAMLVFASTTPMTTMMSSLRRLGVPAACVDVISVMYRLVFVLLESVSVIRQAQAGRLGYTTARRSLNSAGLLTAAILTRSWIHARRLEIGLVGRDFGQPMPTLDESRPQPRFVLASMAVLGVIATVSVIVGVLR